MSSLKLNKEVRNGVEYWVSTDGSQVGMSISGLQVLTGTAYTPLRNIVNGYSDHSKMPSERLEDLRNKGIAITPVEIERKGRPVTFIPAEVCMAILEYYSFEAKNISSEVRQVARQNYKDIATVGMKVYILHQVGYKLASPEQQDLAPMLTNILAEMKEMKQLINCYVNIQENIQSKPGLAHILANYEKGYLLSDGKLFTLKTWLQSKNIKLNHSQMSSLGRAVHATFKTHAKKEASKAQRARCYSTEDVPMLESAFKSLGF